MVLITGASGGLGRAFALECAARGFDVFLTDLHERNLAFISDGIRRQYSVNVEAMPCDLTDEKQVAKLFEYISERKLELSMLLNVAGVDFEGEFAQRDCGRIAEIIRLNIEATIRMTHNALSMRAQDGFCIVFVSSLASMYPMPLKATYAASKRFLLDFATALREELRAQKVHVLSLCPGGLPTTDEALLGIEAQGFWGNVTTNRVEVIARKTITRALKGRGRYIPGFVNSVFCAAGKILPGAWIARLLYKRWHVAQQKWQPLASK